MPVTTKEIISDGPEFVAAACPLSTNIPAPKKDQKLSDHT
jgi:hypothetical protein